MNNANRYAENEPISTCRIEIDLSFAWGLVEEELLVAREKENRLLRLLEYPGFYSIICIPE